MSCAHCHRDPCACVADTKTAAAPAHPPAGSPAASAAASRVGRTVGRYRIVAQLGAGGMGVVYRATDGALGRTVALKFLAGPSGPDAQARLHREARAASALDHPNIGTVYEIGEDDGAPFIAMAFYEGETLRERIARGPLPREEATAIAAQLAAALVAAHGAGVLHRDLKPANVMLTRSGVKLLDFGLAKLADPSDQLTQEGVVLGTLAYMAPEQLRAEPVDARADLWALGAVLYEMLTGRAPFAASTAASVATKILHEREAPIREPAQLGRLVAQLLEKNRESRPASAAAVLSALTGGKAIARRGLPPAAWVLLALVLIGGGAAVLVAVRPRPASLPAAEAAEVAPDPRALALYEQATRKFDLGKYDEGVKLFEQIYELTGETTILYNAAQSLRLAGQKSRAAEMYRSYLRREPGSPLKAEVEKKIRELGGTP